MHIANCSNEKRIGKQLAGRRAGRALVVYQGGRMAAMRAISAECSNKARINKEATPRRVNIARAEGRLPCSILVS
ncbi:hypothetical protein J6590_064878 [Homalodisca vitripennis]|nr:hypothetical protein J6590_064878 [Homalodisca vitripennis]